MHAGVTNGIERNASLGTEQRSLPPSAKLYWIGIYIARHPLLRRNCNSGTNSLTKAGQESFFSIMGPELERKLEQVFQGSAVNKSDTLGLHGHHPKDETSDSQCFYPFVVFDSRLFQAFQTQNRHCTLVGTCSQVYISGPPTMLASPSDVLHSFIRRARRYHKIIDQFELHELDFEPLLSKPARAVTALPPLQSKRARVHRRLKILHVAPQIDPAPSTGCYGFAR
jgi:hypothetical protein